MFIEKVMFNIRLIMTHDVLLECKKVNYACTSKRYLSYGNTILILSLFVPKVMFKINIIMTHNVLLECKRVQDACTGTR